MTVLGPRTIRTSIEQRSGTAECLVLLTALLASGCFDYQIPDLITDPSDSFVSDNDSDTSRQVGDSENDTSDTSSESTVTDSGSESESESETHSDPADLPIATPRLCAGNNHTCVLVAANDGRCWGHNILYGQLGDGGLPNRNTPVSVALTETVVAIYCGYNHTCAVLATGTAQCWGRDNCGQVGVGPGSHGTTCNDSMTNYNTPQDVGGLSQGVAQIAAGGAHSCALLTNGAVHCWGNDGDGQLGNDSTLANQNTPQPVAGLGTGVTALAAGYKHTCAVHDGALKCWGDNAYGQLGSSTEPNDHGTPVQASGLTSGVTAVTAGDYHTCALLTSDEVRCFGRNQYGQLGNGEGGTFITESSSVPVLGLGASSGVVQIAAGTFHTCALRDNEELLCWGRNLVGQLGNGESGNEYHAPTPIFQDGTGIVEIITGEEHTCALFDDNHVECWGRETWGELGNGPAGDETLPDPTRVLYIP